MSTRELFGERLRKLRTENGMSLRNLAEHIGVSAQYLSEVEKGRSSPLAFERIETVCKLFHLNDDEKEELYDLAAVGSGGTANAPQDCIDMVSNADYIVKALRLSKRANAGKDEWDILIEAFRRKIEKEQS